MTAIPNNDPLTITAVSNLAERHRNDQRNNTITYTPAAGFSGSDSFSYTISDGYNAEFRASQRDGHAAARRRYADAARERERRGTTSSP